jgi:hypothetical protein
LAASSGDGHPSFWSLRQRREKRTRAAFSGRPVIVDQILPLTDTIDEAPPALATSLRVNDYLSQNGQRKQSENRSRQSLVPARTRRHLEKLKFSFVLIAKCSHSIAINSECTVFSRKAIGLSAMESAHVAQYSPFVGQSVFLEWLSAIKFVLKNRLDKHKECQQYEQKNEIGKKKS